MNRNTLQLNVAVDFCGILPPMFNIATYFCYSQAVRSRLLRSELRAEFYLDPDSQLSCSKVICVIHWRQSQLQDRCISQDLKDDSTAPAPHSSRITWGFPDIGNINYELHIGRNVNFVFHTNGRKDKLVCQLFVTGIKMRSALFFLFLFPAFTKSKLIGHIYLITTEICTVFYGLLKIQPANVNCNKPQYQR